MQGLRRPISVSLTPGRSWWWDSTLLSASILLGGVLNYLYHVVLGRLLGPQAYGSFGALLGIFYLLWIFGQSAQLHMAHSTAQGLRHPGRELRSIALLAFGVALSLGAFSGPLAQVFRLDSPFWIVWLSLIWLLCLPLLIAKGILQGHLQFPRLAALNVLEPAIKLLAGISFVLLGLGLWGAWGAWAMGALLTSFFALRTLASSEGTLPSRTAVPEGENLGGLALLAALVLAIPTNVDILIVKASFSAYDAGLYTAAAVIGKGFLFLALGVSAALLPKAAGASNSKEGKVQLAKALKVAGLLNGMGALVCAIAPDLLVQLLFGEVYLESALLVRFYGLAMLMFTGVALLAHYGLARGHKPLLLGFVALSALEVVILAWGVSSPLQVVLTLLVSHTIMLAMGAISLRRTTKEAHPAVSLSPKGVALVATYPPPHIWHGAAGGVASYTRNLAEALTRSGCPLSILANRLPESSDHEPHVTRCWKPGVPYVFQIWREVRQQRPALVHLQHEFFLFGSGLSALFFPLLLLLLRPLTWTVVTLHGVLPLSKLTKGFLRENGLQGHPALLRLALFLIIRVIVVFAHRVIVHEDRLKEYLVSEYRCPLMKIAVVPHGLELRPIEFSTREAKLALGFSDQRVILYLGYLTGYKGIEVLLEGFSRIASSHPNWVLVVAGGPHPRRQGESSYKAYVQEIEARATQLGSQVRLLGFVPEEKLSQVFLAADLVIFPYRELIASSGPLALCMSYDRPFLSSKAFTGLLDERLLFELDPDALASKIEEFFASKELAQLAQQQAATWRATRHWDRVAQLTLALYRNLLREDVAWTIKAHQEGDWELGHISSLGRF